MIYGIILASGLGTRCSSVKPKQFAKIAGKTVLEHTIEVFERSQHIDHIIIIITPQYRYILEDILLKNHYKKVNRVLNGGKTRKESSWIAISSIQDEEAKVVIHDAARPFLSTNTIEKCIEALEKYDAVDTAIPSTDTLIEVNEKQEIISIPDRSTMRRGQTPQCFKLSIIKKAHELSKNDEDVTDDCTLVIRHNLSPVYVVTGESKNIKITVPEDILFADKLFQINTQQHIQQSSLEALRSKVFVVFGGSSGIGLHIIELAQRYGAITYAFSRTNGIDITNYKSVESTLKEVFQAEGRIDYVLNTAAILTIGKLLDKESADMQKEIEINYLGNIFVCKASIPYLLKTKGALLLFTSSSYTRGRALYSLYSSSKAAVVNLTQALAEELYDDGVKINAINPERTATPMRTANFGKEPDGSLLTPEKVATVCLYTLLSNQTGQVVDVKLSL